MSSPRPLPTLLWLACAELLAMTVWFSGSAVVDPLTVAWTLGPAGQAWLTMSVQIGFVVGALVSSLLNLPDRVSARGLFAGSALLAAGVTAAIPVISVGIGSALVFRFFTGFFLAGVYPVGMKIMATWTRKRRGLAIGLLVAALTFGNAAPHLIRALGDTSDWHRVLFLSAALAALGGIIALLFVTEGPYRSLAPRLSLKQVGVVLTNRPVMLANIGYLGHMWELFAMWSWVPVFFFASFERSGVAPVWTGVAGFAVVAAGAPGSLLAGVLADRFGRTRIISASLVGSGACALVVGHLFGSSPLLVFVVAMVWGFTVVADSAQYSACVTELADQHYVGTALTIQTSLGFLLTLITIRVVPTLVDLLGWGWSFSLLAIGPVAGLVAMRALGRTPGVSGTITGTAR